jgi:hypothetical protein
MSKCKRSRERGLAPKQQSERIHWKRWGSLLWCLSPYPTGQPCWSWAARHGDRHRDLAFCQVFGQMGHGASPLISLAFTV